MKPATACLFVFFSAYLLAGCAASETAQPPTGEHLRALPPDGWLAGVQTQTPLLRLSEYLAPDTTGEGWTDKVTFERLSAKPVASAAEFIASTKADLSGTCEGSQFFSTFSGKENGYQTEVVLWTCPLYPVTRTGQITMLKVVQGNDALYIVTRARRLSAFNDRSTSEYMPREDIAQWSAYLSAISVCDTSREALHPCG